MTFDVTYDTGVTDELLVEFAKALMANPTNREHTALRICGGDFDLMQRLMQRASTTDFTTAMLSLQREMTTEERLQTKADFCIEVRDKISGFNGELWLKGATFYAKLMGFTEEKINNTTIQNVIVVPQGAPDPDAWSAGAAQYASKLQAEAKVIDVE